MSECIFKSDLTVLESIRLDELLLYVLTMFKTDIGFTIYLNNDLHTCLDHLLKDVTQQEPNLRVALILTGTGKYFSIGLDLPSYYETGTPQESFHKTYQSFIARMMSLPMITIAAINGHAIAGGMVAACSCDYRVMNQRVGYLAMSEINLPSSIPAGMLKIVQYRIKSDTLQREIFLQGKRYTGKQMYDSGFIDVLADDPDKVLEEAKKLAALAAHSIKKMPFLKLIKTVQHQEPLKFLTEPEETDHFTLAFKLNKL